MFFLHFSPFLPSNWRFLALFEVGIEASYYWTCTAGPEPMFLLPWKLYLYDFLIFGSPLAHLEPELKLFEVDDDGEDDMSHHYLPNLQMTIRRDRPLKRSCKWPSGGAGLLQMAIWRGQTLANDHPKEEAYCKWSSGGQLE